MDKTKLLTNYPRLLEHLRDKGLSRSTIYCYQREITAMLQNEPFITHLDQYCQHVEESCDSIKGDVYKRILYIKKIWHFIDVGEPPKCLKSNNCSLIDEYKSILETCALASKGLGHKEKTTSDYVDVMRSFLMYIQNKHVKNLQDVTETIVQDYFTIGDISKRGYTISGRLRRAFLMVEDIIGQDIVRILLMYIPRIPHKTHVYPDLTEEESKLIEIALSDTSNTLPDLNRAIGCLAYFMGLRGSDIVNLSRENLDFKKQTIRIEQKKTSVPLEIPMPITCSNAIVKYVKSTRPKNKCKFIFVQSETRERLNKRDLYRLSMEILHFAGIKLYNKKMRGLHLFRHHFATTLIGRGTDVSIASALLGHRRPESTFMYVGTDVETLKSCALQLQ